MSTIELETEFNRLKKQKRNLYTNFFFQDIDKVYCNKQGSEASLFFTEERYFFRLYYLYTDAVEFRELLAECIFDKPIVFDLISNDADYAAEFSDSVYNIGFNCIAKFNRMECYALKDFRVTKEIEYASLHDKDEIFALMYDVFNPDIDHLLSKDTLLDYIEKKFVIINRFQGVIEGFIIFQIKGNRAHFNFLYNKSEDVEESISLIYQYYSILKDQKFTNSYLWVDKKNTKVIRLHKLCGYSEDGFVNYIFRK